MAEVTIKKDDGTEISKIVSNDNIDSVSNEANSEEISKGLDKFWTEKKLGKHKDAKEKQKQLLMKYLTGNPANFFSALNESKFNVGNFGPSSISNILVDANLSKYIKKEYIKDALSITSARPAIGKGEFLFASLFNNIGFSKNGGDLIDLNSNEKIEVKGSNAVIGNGQNEKYKSLSKSLIYSLFNGLGDNSKSYTKLNDECAQELKKLLGIDSKKIEKCFLHLENIENENETLAKQATEIYLEKKYFLKTLAALHLFIYLTLEKASYFLALNDKKFRMFTSPKSIKEAYDIIDNFEINGWKEGNPGISFTLK